MNTKISNRIVFVLAVLGMCIAGYVAFTWLTGSPIVCISGGCETVRKNPFAWPFGIPFPLFGLAGYLIIAILSFLNTASNNYKKYHNFILGMAIFGSLLVTYFSFLEAFVIRGFCMWCVFSAIDMYLILFLTLGSRKKTV